MASVLETVLNPTETNENKKNEASLAAEESTYELKNDEQDEQKSRLSSNGVKKDGTAGNSDDVTRSKAEEEVQKEKPDETAEDSSSPAPETETDDSDINLDMTPPDWHEIYMDSSELESLLFCIRRPTARNRLFKLISNLKLLSGKLKRHEEVTLHLNGQTSSYEKVLRRKRALEDAAAEEPKAKKPRAIPLDDPLYKPRSILNGSSSALTDVNGLKEIELKLPKSYDPMTKPPTLKEKDKWVLHHKKESNEFCPDFSATNLCPLGSKCNHLHIFTPRKPRLKVEVVDGKMVTMQYSKEDVDRAYEKYRNISLSKSDYSEKIKNNELNTPNYCCSIVCPLDGTIFYAQPFPGDTYVKANQNFQGIWWYTTMKDAKDAVSTIIITDLQERGIVPKDFKPRDLSMNGDHAKRNAVSKATQQARKAITSGNLIKEKNIAPSILPDITPWNWMESNHSKRCAQYNSPKGCPFGKMCQYAHVHFHTDAPNKYFPDREALPLAYMHNFQLVLQDSFFQGTPTRSNDNSPFRVMTAVDNRGKLWYTAALKCPQEGTIYYAAGGSTGRLNKQNSVLYPRVEDAKLAVAGIVLASFQKRGLRASWTVPKNMPQTHKTKFIAAPSPAVAPPPPPAPAVTPVPAPLPPPPPKHNVQHVQQTSSIRLHQNVQHPHQHQHQNQNQNHQGIHHHQQQQNQNQNQNHQGIHHQQQQQNQNQNQNHQGIHHQQQQQPQYSAFGQVPVQSTSFVPAPPPPTQNVQTSFHPQFHGNGIQAQAQVQVPVQVPVGVGVVGIMQPAAQPTVQPLIQQPLIQQPLVQQPQPMQVPVPAPVPQQYQMTAMAVQPPPPPPPPPPHVRSYGR